MRVCHSATPARTRVLGIGCSVLGSVRPLPSTSHLIPNTLMIAWRRPTLPPLIRGSTIGAGGLNCRVRDGYGCFPSATTARTRVGVGSWVLGVGTEPSDPNTPHPRPNTRIGAPSKLQSEDLSSSP